MKKEYCDITGERLTPDNIEVDHILPKSLYSKTKYDVLSKRGNRLKSNITPQEAKNLYLYFKKHGYID